MKQEGGYIENKIYILLLKHLPFLFLEKIKNNYLLCMLFFKYMILKNVLREKKMI